ncbi:MAG TPA: LysM peptidoglycan-binding domain-containing protein [Thermoleophilaceae bacterium]|nr:LysM peptidoglycan-binding domain-containing protein [Thermoleophilaceae bacterium]
MLALALLAPAVEPAVAGATEPGEETESESEGAADPRQGDPDTGVGDLTPGQDDTGDTEDENSPPLLAPGDTSDPNEGENEAGPVEVEPQNAPGEPQPQAVTPVPPPTAPAPPPAVPAPPTQHSPSQTVPAAKPAPAPHKRVAPVRRKPEKPARAKPREPEARSVPVAGARPAQVPEPTRAPSRTAEQPSTPVLVPAASSEAYTVRAGDTLWSIAADQLGEGASAAQIARHVQRLWDLNARAIGTGDPSLLHVGVRLRLR